MTRPTSSWSSERKSPARTVLLADPIHIAAAKCYDSCLPAADMKRFDKEIELLRACNHPAIIQPIDVVRKPPTYAIVLPFMANGTLFSLLHASGKTMKLDTKVGIAVDIAAAVVHLHERGILHRDIKSDNILVHADGSCVLADLNAAEWMQCVTADITMVSRPTGGFFKQFVVGTLPYMAPELLLAGGAGALYTPSCDIYSFGITLCEMISQIVPYADALTEKMQLHTILEARYNNDALTAAITADGLRPSLPPLSDHALEPLFGLIRSCWHHDPAERPSGCAVAAELSKLTSTMQSPGGPRELWEDVAMPTPAIARSTGILLEDALVPGQEVLAKLSVSLQLTTCTTLRVGVDATAGRRGADRMEDAHVLLTQTGICLSAVFDGHGGAECAKYASARLPTALANSWPVGPGGERDLELANAALHNSFLALHNGFVGSELADDSGCTALAVLCLPGKVIVANAGDCQCWLWRNGKEMVPLNSEHTAANSAERARVEATGAVVKPAQDGKLRVQGIIQVTRCLGDRRLRGYGLLSEPEMTEHGIEPSDDAIVMASDGLWDVLSPQRVDYFMRNTAKSPDMIAKRLIIEALDAGSDDNVTVAVIFLRDLSLMA